MEQRFVPRNVGDQISAENAIILDGISSVVPVRYNGMCDTYDVCQPDKATHTAVISDNDYAIIVPRDCPGHDNLIDLI